MTKDLQSIYNQVVLILEERFPKYVSNEISSKDADTFQVKPIIANGKEVAKMLMYIYNGKRISVSFSFIGNENLKESFLENYYFDSIPLVRIGYKTESDYTTQNKINHVKEVVNNIDKIVEIIEKTISFSLETYKSFIINRRLEISIVNSKISIYCYTSNQGEMIEIRGTYKSIKSKFFLSFIDTGNKMKVIDFYYADFDKIKTVNDMIELNSNRKSKSD
jgi:acyl carrier protein